MLDEAIASRGDEIRDPRSEAAEAEAEAEAEAAVNAFGKRPRPR